MPARVSDASVWPCGCSCIGCAHDGFFDLWPLAFGLCRAFPRIGLAADALECGGASGGGGVVVGGLFFVPAYVGPGLSEHVGEGGAGDVVEGAGGEEGDVG